MITPRWILGFIGHRRTDDPVAAKQWIMTALTSIQQDVQAKGGLLELYMSCAIGTDMLCIECARELRIPVHLILPLAEKEFLKDFDTDDEVRTCREVIATAEQGTHGDSLRVCQSVGARPDCYYDMSQQILQGSDALLVFWNGAEARGLGGTAEMYELARRMGLPLGWIHAQDGNFAKEQWPADWPEPDPEIDGLNAAAKRSLGIETPPDSITDVAASLSTMNRRHAPFVRKMITTIIVVNAIAALLGSIAIISSQLNDDDRKIGPAIWLSVNFALVLSASYMVRFLRTRRVFDTWVHGRVAAEIVRGIRSTQPALDPLHPMVRQRAPEWARFALSASLMARQELPKEPIDDFRDRYIKERLDGKIAHFDSFGDHAERVEGRLTKVGDLAALAAPLCVGIVFLNKLFRYLDIAWLWQKTLLGAILIGLVPVLFPLISGTAAALNSAFDARRRSRRYPELVAQLGANKEQLAELRTPATILNAVQSTETTLLNELLEWRSTVPHKAAEKRG